MALPAPASGQSDRLRHLGSHEIQHLLHQYGCALVFAVVALQAAGAPLPGTTALIAAALYAATAHGLPIAGVIAAGALGALLGTSAGFVLGRWRGEQVLSGVARRLGQPPARVQALRREFARSGGLWLFAGRFITGLRNVVGLLAGTSGMAIARFLPLCAAAAVVWAVICSLEYYYFGHALASADTWLQIVLICAGVAWLLVSFELLRRRAMRRLGVPID
jgi:membrane protein DedA with SNARE-associated domain